MTFQDLLDQVAFVVGGTRPDPAGNPHWWSGAATGDGTGIAGIQGCWSAPPETIQIVPSGVVLMGRFEARGPEQPEVFVQGAELQVEDLRLLLFVRRVDPKDTMANLAPYRDLVPAAFRQHIQLGGLPGVLQAMCTGGHAGVFGWGATQYLGIEFTVRVHRLLTVTYTP